MCTQLLEHMRCVEQVAALSAAVTMLQPDMMTTFDLFALPKLHYAGSFKPGC